jgi:hypothetical protein
MYVKVEPSGCCERKGLVQVRFAMYLAPEDYAYEKHKDTPFHNHFIYVEPDTTNEEIMDIGEAFLHEAYIKWASDKELDLRNEPVQFHIDTNISRKSSCEGKVTSIKSAQLERSIK